MRNILLIIAIAFCLKINAQPLPKNTPITINIGTKGYVVINGQNYMRGSLRSYFNPNDSFTTGSGKRDSTLSILYMPDRTLFIRPTVDTLFIYGDSSNRKVYNFNYLKNWIDSNFEYRGN